ncbi:unnamed protein product [Rotaria sordida]|uniref:G-protein coupled receptors family 1 profile domain-containing protein n=1 Tax=Rotaria sordida TaxID=392033 RepID=A0A819CHK8_9BILA|nr:unnamed protein product [Rotaria sordida]CAF3818282.1 unnamed protein product [Rotaria sordida]
MPNTTTSYMRWFSVINIFTNIIASCQILFGLIFISIILYKRAYRSVSNCLAANIAFSITFYAITVLAISIHISQCDNHPDQCTEERSYIILNYMNDVASTAVIYSFTGQSIHHLLSAIFARNIRLQMYQIRLSLFIIQWIIAFLFPYYFVYVNPQLKYNTVSYVWVVSKNLSPFLTLYILLIGFILPVMIIISVYIKLTLFIAKLRRSTVLTGLSSTLSNRHDLQMSKYIILLLTIAALSLLPQTIFQSMKSPPSYRYRIYYLTETIITFCCFLCLFACTSLVRRRLNRWKVKIKRALDYLRERSTVLQGNRY